MSQTRHNLPKLKANHGLRGLDEAGRWMSLNIDLNAVAKALPVDETQAFPDQDEPIRAIPDPWAQASAFGLALLSFDPKNPEKGSSMGRMAHSQWRGLLALLALQNFHKTDFNLLPRAVNLSDGSHFANVMTTLTPEVALAGQADLWRTPSLIMVAEKHDQTGMFAKPIAMTNPICLVSPGRTTARILVPNIDWAQGDLQCPFSPGQPTRSVAELSTLYHWLDELIAHIQTMPGEVAKDITRLLMLFAEDVRTKLGREPFGKKLAQNAQNNLPPLFRPLFNEIILDDIQPTEAISETKVISLPMAGDSTDAGPSNRLKGFILADYAVAEAMRKDPSHVMVWKRHSLTEVLRSKEKLAAVRRDALESGYMLLTIDDLLTDRAVQFRKMPLIDAHDGAMKEMVLPLRPLALLLTGSEHNESAAAVIKSRVRVQISGDRATFTYTVRLDGGGEQGTGVDLVRHYSANPQEGEGLLVHDSEWVTYNCQLWPNFRSSVWHSYMARFYYTASKQNKMTRPQQGISVAILRDIIDRADTITNIDTALRNCNTGIKLTNREYDGPPLLKAVDRLTANGKLYEEVQYSTAPFDAIIYVDSFGDERMKKPVGLVLVDLEPKAAPVHGTNVAIDFGTTNTVGAFGEAKADPVVFKNRLVFPLQHAEEAIRENVIHASRNQFVGFMPPEPRPTPIPTVAKPVQPYDSAATPWAFRNLIYFHTSQPPSQGGEFSELSSFKESTSDAKFNLKWSQEDEIAKAAQDFLTQFIVMTAAELIDKNYDPVKCDWYFSVPESLGRTQANRFFITVQEALRNAGIDLSKGQGKLHPLKSEGLSAANYMLTHGGFTNDKLAIVLDIGGGTTDMTIWDQKTPLWRGSIKLAGGNFYTELLVNNSEILRSWNLVSWAKSLDPKISDMEEGSLEEKERKLATLKSGTWQKDRRNLAEMLFSGRSSGSDGKSQLQEALGNDSAAFIKLTSATSNPLRYAAVTYLAGIAWYLGLVVRHFSYPTAHAESGMDAKGDAKGAEETAANGRKEDDGVHGFILPNDVLLTEGMADDPAFALCGRGGGIFKTLHGGAEPDERTEITRALSVFGRAVALPDAKRPRFSASEAPKLEVVRGMLTDDGDISTTAKFDEDDGDKIARIMPLGLGLTTEKGVLAPDSLLTTATYQAGIKSVDLTEFQSFLHALEECVGISIDVDMGKSENAARHIRSKTENTLKAAAKDIAGTVKVQASKIVMEPPFLIALRELIAIMASPAEVRDAKMKIWGED